MEGPFKRPLYLLPDFDRDDGLLLYFVERYCLIFHFVEIDFAQVDTANGTVVHRAVINGPVGYVGCHGPLCRAGEVNGDLVRCVFNPDGYVEVVQYLKALQNGSQT